MSATQNNNATGTATATAAAPQEAPSIKGPGLPPIVQRLEKGQKTPVCVIVVGMAGSGKSSLMAQMQHHLNSGSRRKTTTTSSSAEDSKPAAKEESSPKEEEKDTAVVTATNTSESEDDAEGPDTAYCINLDPATHHLSFDASIDIRDTINYKEVMKQHNLGPNGGIMTSMLLYSTKFDQVMGILEKRAYGSDDAQAAAAAANKQGGGGGGGDNATSSPPPSTVNNDGMDYILVDTPGQIEAFTWSASGSIISESLASAFPTVLCFVIDTARCASSPNTFMSNMLYACSMFYRTRLPVVIAFNKNDVVPHDFAVEWMKDYEAFQEALDESMESNTNNASTISSTGFYGSLTRSLSLVLDEFYSNFTHCCGVSAVTGDGMDDFWDAIDKAAREDFAMDYVDDLKNRMEEQQAKQRAMARASVRRMERDLQQDPQNR